MKDLKEAKVGDLVFDTELNKTLVIAEIDGGILTVSSDGLILPFDYTMDGKYIHNEKSVKIRTLFYKGQITENEYLGLSADGVKMFSGMRVWAFENNNSCAKLDIFIIRDKFPLKACDNYSAAYSTKEAAEKAQKEHFKPETFPLPDWFWVGLKIGFSTDRLMLAVNNDLGAIYQHGYTWYKASFPESKLKAHFVKAQFSELKDGDFFTLGADLDYILMKINNEKYVQITNKGEVINHNLGKLSEVFKVVASEVEKAIDSDGLVEVGTLKNGDIFKHKGSEYVFSYNHDGDTVCNELISNEWIGVVFYSKTKVTKIDQPTAQKVAIGTLSVGEFFTLNPSGDVFMIDIKSDYAVSYVCVSKNSGIICYELDQLVYKIQKQ